LRLCALEGLVGHKEQADLRVRRYGHKVAAGSRLKGGFDNRSAPS
jgi:hypothetical protein